MCQALKPLFDVCRPNLFSNDPDDLAADGRARQRTCEPRPQVLHDRVRLLTGSAADFLDDYFESDIIKGCLSSSSIIGTKVGPRRRARGSCCSSNIGEHDGHFGSWAFHKGGNGGFTQVLASAAQAFGAEIVLDAEVAQVITANGRAIGVALEDGTEFDADVVVSAARPAAYVHRSWSIPGELPTDLVDNIGRFDSRAPRPRSTSPSTACRRTRRSGDRTDQFRGFTNIGPSIDYLERAFDEAKYGWYS